MNQKNSLLNLLLVSTAALSGYQKGARNQYNYSRMYLQPTHRNDTYSASNTTTNTTIPPTNVTNPSSVNTPSNSVTSNNTTSSSNTSTMTSNMNTNMSSSITPINLSTYSPTAAAQADNTFLPLLLAALYAANEAVGIPTDTTGPFSLAPLEYDYNALEPYISEETLRTHHCELHQRYVDQLNTALNRYPEFHPYTIEEFLLFPDRLPSDIQTQVINNAGGDYNHSLTWKLIGPLNQSRPTGAFAEAIDNEFGSFENLKSVLKEAGLSVFGTGYAWLALNPYGRMLIATTEEQLTPIPLRTVPLLPIDVWEHAYFLDRSGHRSAYIDSYFNLINWDRVGDRYNAAMEVLSQDNSEIY